MTLSVKISRLIIIESAQYDLEKKYGMKRIFKVIFQGLAVTRVRMQFSRTGQLRSKAAIDARRSVDLAERKKLEKLEKDKIPEVLFKVAAQCFQKCRFTRWLLKYDHTGLIAEWWSEQRLTQEEKKEAKGALTQEEKKEDMEALTQEEKKEAMEALEKIEGNEDEVEGGGGDDGKKSEEDE
jgi:hypothetical protein